VAVDRTLRDSLSVLMQSAGRVVGGDDVIPVAALVITDARAGAKPAVAGLRARTRSDAAIIVVLAASAPTSEVHAAYEAGAVLCLRSPVDEHQLLAAIGSAIDLHTAKVHADDLMRQLDVQAHLASLGRVTAGFTHEVSNPLTVLTANLETVSENATRLLEARDLLVAIEQSGPSSTMRLVRECLSHMSSARAVRSALDDMGTALQRINGVLETARALAQGSPSGCIEDVDLISLARDVRRWASSELKGVEVQELIDEPIDEPITARADPRLLRQIVLNLVTNAAHAVRKLPSPRVRLHVYGLNETASCRYATMAPASPPKSVTGSSSPSSRRVGARAAPGSASLSAESTPRRCKRSSLCGPRPVEVHAFASTFHGQRHSANGRRSRKYMRCRTEIETEVIDVIRRQLQASGKQLDAWTRFVDDLGADSLAVVELTLVFEETFDIEIPDEEANRIRTVRDATTAVEKYIRARLRG
jgi:acyl carrier protein